MDELTCKGCRFYKEDRAESWTGLCRRYPPASPAPKSLLWALSELVWFAAGESATVNQEEHSPEGQGSDNNDRALWPSVYEDDWCGEFSPPLSSRR